MLDTLWETHEIYVWNDVLEDFSDWLDTIDERCEQCDGLNTVLAVAEIRALSLIASRINGLLKGDKLVPILPVLNVNQPLISDLAFMVNSWCGGPLAEQVSGDEFNCLNDIYGKLTQLLRT